MAVSKRLRQSLRWGREERIDFYEAFLETKIFTYVEALGELARELGYEIEDDEIDVSDDVLRALRDEAREHAAMVVQTYNRDLDEFLDRNRDLPRADLLRDYESWAESRADAKAETIATTEAYSAAAEATVGFFLDNGLLDAEFDFGGHGDDDPVCEICEALRVTSPHPAERVISVGNPHIGCRQDWHPRVSEADLPEEVQLGRAPAGIVGAQHFLGQHGDDRTAAAQAILDFS